MSNKVSTIHQLRHQRFEHIAVAGRGDGVEDENAVCHGLTKVEDYWY